MLQPMNRPVIDITTNWKTRFAMSAMVRPASTPERAMGSERNRSTMPLVMSLAMATLVWAEAKAAIWAKMPAIRNSL